MTNPVKGLRIYIALGAGSAALTKVLADLGLDGQPFRDPSAVLMPAVIVMAPGQDVPEGFQDVAVSLPAEAPVAAVAELLRLAMEKAALKLEVKRLEEQANRQHRQFEELNRIGIALSAERDIKKLQELILTTLRELTYADGASLWLIPPGDEGPPMLRLSSSQNDSIGSDTYRDFAVPVDQKSVVGYTVIMGTSQIYDDAYNPPPGKPPGGRGFDAQFGYRTKSMLTVPMRNYNNKVVGAVQLINAKRNFETKLTVDTVEQEVVSFRPKDLEMIESIASQAAVAIDKQILIEDIQLMFDGFVEAGIYAIERRDPATAGHSERVMKLTTGLALAVNEIAVAPFRDVRLNDDQLKELRYACLLHDFGKVGVSEDVLVKAKKLLPRQLDLIQARFEYVQLSEQVKYLGEQIEIMRKQGVGESALNGINRRRLEEELQKLRSWLKAVEAANEPTVLPEDKASMIKALASRTYRDMAGKEHPLLDPQEFRFLSIRKGTLDEQERREIESHVTHSYNFLRKIRWTPLMRGIPDIAYAHHEKLDGSGYPRGLTETQIPPQSKMMTIADIYDALTASDRPYKPAVSATRALDILHDEAARGQLDRDLLDVFQTNRIYELTAKK